jgi:hypothetical protein
MACNLPLDPNCKEPRIKTFNSDCSTPQQTAYFDAWNKKCSTYTANNNCKLPINDPDFDCTKPIITDFTECSPTESDAYIEKYNKKCLPVLVTKKYYNGRGISRQASPLGGVSPNG